jgi:ankyrin repeat protein
MKNIPVAIFLLCIIVVFGRCRNSNPPKPSPRLAYDEKMFPLIENNDIDAIRELINSGFDINSTTPNGYTYTPLTYAITQNKPDVVIVLLENGADIELCTTFGSPLAIAAYHDNFDLVKLLLDRGADINNDYRFTDWSSTAESAIFCAAVHLNFEMYDYLLERGADVNRGKAIEEENALLAVIGNYGIDNRKSIIYREQIISMIKKLINDGINVNYSVWWGNALTDVVYKNDLEIMEILLNNGADLNLFIDEYNKNTYEFIQTYGSKEMIELVDKMLLKLDPGSRLKNFTAEISDLNGAWLPEWTYKKNYRSAPNQIWGERFIQREYSWGTANEIDGDTFSIDITAEEPFFYSPRRFEVTKITRINNNSIKVNAYSGDINQPEYCWFVEIVFHFIGRNTMRIETNDITESSTQRRENGEGALWHRLPVPDGGA